MNKLPELTKQQIFDLELKYSDVLIKYNMIKYGKCKSKKAYYEKGFWRVISQYVKLPEDFIREYKDFVNWMCISCHQKMSDDFMREFKDYIHWDNVSLLDMSTELFNQIRWEGYFDK